MSFTPHTLEDREQMLAALGVSNLQELFGDIPASARIERLNIPDGLSEQEVYDRLHALSHKNAHELTCFIGGGFYDHSIPAAVDTLSSRGEFFTAYTPYQPEVAQGTLQAIFEFQSMVCRLTGMDVANASMYDGGTALVEAALMAIRSTNRPRIIVAGGLNPIYRRMLDTYTRNLHIDMEELPVDAGAVDRVKLASLLTDQTAAVIIQNPNFFGTIEDFSDISAMAHAQGALMIASIYPIAMGLVKSPAEMGCDIVVGEGQSLGLPLSFGGPYLGFFAVQKALVRKMPGRIVGETTDRHGNRCYVLTLQAREQHIRREKAASNICSNEALCALRATIYLSLLGKQGLTELARTCMTKAEYAKAQFAQIKGVKVKNSGPTFNEFVLELPCNASDLVAELIPLGLIAGFPLGRYYPELQNCLLVAITEKRTQAEIDGFVSAVKGLLK
jgi:glycine dehydrogenase subunit 1